MLGSLDRDQKLIRAIIHHGSRQAADQLIQTYYDEIYRFCFRQTGNKEDAMGLTQTIFLAVLRSLPSYDGSRASFRTWLYCIAANKVVDARRKGRPVFLSLNDMEIPETEDFTERIHERELVRQIEDFVSHLDPQLQTVFRLRVYGEQSFAEIADSLCRSESTVKSQFYRLLGRMRKELFFE